MRLSRVWSIIWKKLTNLEYRWRKEPLAGFLVHGSNGEFAYLTAKERVEVIRVVKEEVLPDNFFSFSQLLFRSEKVSLCWLAQVVSPLVKPLRWPVLWQVRYSKVLKRRVTKHENMKSHMILISLYPGCYHQARVRSLPPSPITSLWFSSQEALGMYLFTNIVVSCPTRFSWSG